MVKLKVTHMVTIIGLTLFVCSMPHSQSSDLLPKPSISVVFRYDDYSSKSPTDLELRILDIFQQFGAKCTFGVIPYVVAGDETEPGPRDEIPLSRAKAQILTEALAEGFLEVAQHGFSHQTVREKTDGGFTRRHGRNHSEFFGVDFEEQLSKIAKGKKYLEEILPTRVTTFIPPWNHYDLNTLSAIEKTGFGTFSAARRGVGRASSQLIFLPMTTNLTGLRRAIGQSRQLQDPDPIVVVLFHHYDFVESDLAGGQYTLTELADLLEWVSAQDDVRTKTIAQLADEDPQLTSWRFFWNSESPHWRATPPFISRIVGWEPDGIYLSISIAQSLKLRRWGLGLLSYLGIALVSAAASFGLGKVLRTWPTVWLRMYVWSAFLGMLVIMIYVLKDYVVFSGGDVAIVLSLGFWLGAWSISYKRKRTLRMGRESNG